MGSRSFNTGSPEYYSNLYRMMSGFSIAHEGDPAVSLEMLEAFTQNRLNAEYYQRMFEMLGRCLASHEGSDFGFESSLMDEQ